MAVGDTYTSNQGSVMDNINRLTRDVTSQIQGAPAARQQMGEQLMETEGSLGPLAADRGAMIEKLFNADQELSKQYSNPQGEYYIENPMARSQAVTGMESKMWGALGNINSLIEARKSVLGDAVNRGMEIYKAGLQSKEFELDNLYKQLDLADKQSARAESNELERLKIAASLGAGGGVKFSAAARTQLAAWNTARSQLAEVISKYRNARTKVGPIGGAVLKSPLGNIEGLRDPDLDAFQISVGPLKTQLMNAMIGSQMSPKEMELVMSWVPDVTNARGRVDEKLSSLISFIDNRVGGIYAAYEQEPPSYGGSVGGTTQPSIEQQLQNQRGGFTQVPTSLEGNEIVY